uniref:CCR4-NOT transcription complex subunit 1 n=1 Tax=Mesocestoides corti TaxID=53468 RepID=A0A5K3FZG9_MESCO
MLGSFQAKNVTLPPEDRLQLLISNEYSPSANADYTELYSASFINDWPPLLQELVINSLTIHCVLMDNVTDNPIFEWLVDESLFELLGTLISNPCLRRRFGVGACRLLGLISQYQWKESGKEDWGRLVGSCEDVERDPSDSTC